MPRIIVATSPGSSCARASWRSRAGARACCPAPSTCARRSSSPPAPGWRAQLQALDLLARRIRKRGFAQLDLAGRRVVLEAALRGGANGTLPASPLRADHVAVALLAHWAATSEAQDLAYGARIGAGQCRSLADTSRRPLPIAGEAPR